MAATRERCQRSRHGTNWWAYFHWQSADLRLFKGVRDEVTKSKKGAAAPFSFVVPQIDIQIELRLLAHFAHRRRIQNLIGSSILSCRSAFCTEDHHERRNEHQQHSVFHRHCDLLLCLWVCDDAFNPYSLIIACKDVFPNNYGMIALVGASETHFYR